jgi:hypothetical protein
MLKLYFIAVLLGILCYLFCWTDEGFVSSEKTILFLSGDEAAKHVIEDSDGYLSSLSIHDLHIRGTDSLETYKHKIRNSFVDCENDLKIKIRNCIQNMVLDDVPLWLDKEKFLAMPWKIGFMSGATYEYGWPHTRGDVIYLPANSVENGLTNLLLHEQCHVYQKKYAGEFRKYIEGEGFVRVREKKDTDAANPDSDGWVYMKDGEEWGGVYGKDGKLVYKPINKPAYDHPCEYFVYEFV